MGILQDLLKEVPLSSVLKERVALAEEKYELQRDRVGVLERRIADLERDNAALREQVPAQPMGELDADTVRVLVYLFKASGEYDNDVGVLAGNLRMERNVAQYHLDRLHDAGFADVTGGNYLHGHTYWALSSEGRRYAVQKKII